MSECFRCTRNYFCQYRYRNLNACKFHLEKRVEYSTGPTADKTNVTLVRSNDFSRAGNTFPWTSASLKITLMESTYPGQRPQSPSLSPHFLLLSVTISWYKAIINRSTSRGRGIRLRVTDSSLQRQGTELACRCRTKLF